MSTSIKTDDVILNFFKQICDEKNDEKCIELEKAGFMLWKQIYLAWKKT